MIRMTDMIPLSEML